MSLAWSDHGESDAGRQQQARDSYRRVKLVVIVCIAMLAVAFGVAIYAVGVHVGWWR